MKRKQTAMERMKDHIVFNSNRIGDDRGAMYKIRAAIREAVRDAFECAGCKHDLPPYEDLECDDCRRNYMFDNFTPRKGGKR